MATRNVIFNREYKVIEMAQIITFDKSVSMCQIDISPSTQPGQHTRLFEVCNNPYDASPVWVDITDKIGGTIHTFANSTASNHGLGLRLRLTPAPGSEVSFEKLTVRLG